MSSKIFLILLPLAAVLTGSVAAAPSAKHLPQPGCARCAEIAAQFRDPADLCRNPADVPGVDSDILWESLESCLCTGPCSDVCGPACAPPYLISPASITGACAACAQTAEHSQADPSGCGRNFELCSLDAPP